MPESISFRNVVQGTIALAVLFCVIGYLLFQARFLIIGPQIVLREEPHPVQSDRQIFLTGDTYNISRLWLNDRPIYTDAQGNFKEALILENGYTKVTLRATDRYGRETTVARSIVYTPASFIQ